MFKYKNYRVCFHNEGKSDTVQGEFTTVNSTLITIVNCKCEFYYLHL